MVGWEESFDILRTGDAAGGVCVMEEGGPFLRKAMVRTV